MNEQANDETVAQSEAEIDAELAALLDGAPDSSAQPPVWVREQADDDVMPVDDVAPDPSSPAAGVRNATRARSRRSKPCHSTNTWGGSFVPSHVTRSDEFRDLSMPARLMLFEAMDQEFISGEHVNGKLNLSDSSIRGMSRAAVYRARDELLTAGFIVETCRNDHLGRPNGFALTFLSILPTVSAGLGNAPWTDTPPHTWRKTTPAPTKPPVEGFAERWSGPALKTKSTKAA